MCQLDVHVSLLTDNVSAASRFCSEIRRLIIVECGRCKGGMRVQEAKLEADGELVFVQRRILPHGIRDAVRQNIEEMIKDGILETAQSSAWATPIVVARMFEDFILTFNPRLRRCSATTEEPEDFLNRWVSTQFL